MRKVSLSLTALFACLSLLTAVTVMAQKPMAAPAPLPQQVVVAGVMSTPAPAQAHPARPAAPRQVYSYPRGYAYPQQPQYNANRGGRPVTFQEYFGFDGIPFNGSHIQAFRRYHGR